MHGLSRKPIIVIDYDGTVVTHEWPNIGRDIGAVPWLRQWTAAGAKLVLFTMRTDDLLDEAVAWFAGNDIPLWGVQMNPEQHEWTNSNKPYAKLYLDDHGYGVPLVTDDEEIRPYVNWSIVGPTVLEELKGKEDGHESDTCT